MSKQLTFVTGNLNKVDLISKLVGTQIAHAKIDLDEIQSLSAVDIIEHKVRQAYDQLGTPVLVEDAALEFEALDGLPGPFIKFFTRHGRSFEQLCRMLDGFDNRNAKGVVTYGLFDGANLEIVSGSLDGVIVETPRGDGGFGWDVIFSPLQDKGMTLAELSTKERDARYDQMRNLDSLRAVIRAFLEKN